MSLSNAQRAAHSVYAKVATNAILPSITMADCQKLGSNDLLINFSINRDAKASEIAASIEKALDGNGYVVEGSIYPRAENNEFDLTCVVAAAAKSLPYNEEAVKTMSVVHANVFKDNSDDSIWRLVGEGADARLIQSTDVDQSEILRKAFYSTRARAVHAALASVDEVVGEGDFVGFYDEASASVKFGFVASIEDTASIVESETQALVNNVSANAILISMPADGQQHKPAAKFAEITAGVSKSTKEYLAKYIEYLRSLYKSDNAYIQALVAQLKRFSKA